MARMARNVARKPRRGPRKRQGCVRDMRAMAVSPNKPTIFVGRVRAMREMREMARLERTISRTALAIRGGECERWPSPDQLPNLLAPARRSLKYSPRPSKLGQQTQGSL